MIVTGRLKQGLMVSWVNKGMNRTQYGKVLDWSVDENNRSFVRVEIIVDAISGSIKLYVIEVDSEELSEC